MTISPHTEPTVLELLEAASLLERRFDRALSHTKGISFSEYRILSSLAAADTYGSTRIDLANSVGLTASAITRALRPLEKLGLVVTKRSERDARQSLAKLTPAGNELLEDAKGIFQDALRDLPLHGLKKREIIEFQNRLEEINKSLR